MTRRGGERMGPGAADQHAICPQRQHPHHVETGAHVRIGKERGSFLHRLDDRRQHPRCRRRPAELAAAMVRHHDPVRARIHRRAGIVGIQNALDDQRPIPDAFRAELRDESFLRADAALPQD